MPTLAVYTMTLILLSRLKFEANKKARARRKAPWWLDGGSVSAEAADLQQQPPP